MRDQCTARLEQPTPAHPGDAGEIAVCDDAHMINSSLAAFSEGLADIVDAAAPSVIQVLGRRRPASGVVFAPNLIVTTTRALGREDGIQVRRSDGQAFSAEFVGWDPATMLVVLKAGDLGVAPIRAASTPARTGQLALAIGRSWTNVPTATSGMVSIIGGPLPTGPGRAIDRVIRTTAPTHSGFAGGAFVNMSGELAGITTAVEIRGLGVVIPADIALAAAHHLAEHGTVERGYLGVAGQAVRLGDQQRGDRSDAHAVLVIAVTPGSPADTAGILVGDMVLAFDGHAVQSPVDLLELLAGRVGHEVMLTISRGGIPDERRVTIGRKPRG